jgi:DNA-binding NarL/FixJ family response regulator
MIRVLIVDDQALLRESLRFLVEQDPGIQVIGTVANGNEAAEFCAATPPDVVLMDIMMPECDGVAGTRLIKNRHPEIRVMILTTFGESERVVEAMQSGADGYMLKDVEPNALIQAIRSQAAGLPVMHPRIFEMLRCGQPGGDVAPTDAGATNGIRLTDRELDVVRMIVDGKSNKEIGTLLHLSEGTVKNMITAILTKFKLKDRTQLAVLAVKQHLI